MLLSPSYYYTMFGQFNIDPFLPENDKYIKTAMQIARNTLRLSGSLSIGMEVLVDENLQRCKVVEIKDGIAKVEKITGITTHGLKEVAYVGVDQLFLYTDFMQALQELKQADDWSTMMN